MPNRILREGILSSERVAQLSWPAEVFYRRLISVVDDFGRYYATPMLLRAACYPLGLDRVSDSDIGKWLGETRKAALVGTYQVEGKSYLEVLDFRQQVRATKSRFPQMPSGCVADAQQVIADAHLDVDVDVDVDVSGARKRATRLESDWVLPKEYEVWALEAEPTWDSAYCKRVSENFRDYWLAAPKGQKLDWLATWRKWVRTTGPRPGGQVKPADWREDPRFKNAQ